MQEEVLQRLDTLANRLGVAVEHLYAVLVRQAYVEFVQALIGFMLVAGAAYLWYRLGKWYNDENTELDYTSTDHYGFVLVVTGMVLLVVSIGIIYHLVTTIGYLINPEYFAVKKIIELM